MLAALEAKLKTVWHDLTEEGRADLDALLADAKKQLAAFEPLLGQFEGDLKAAIAALEPEVQADIMALLAKLLAGAAPLLGKAPEPPAPA